MNKTLEAELEKLAELSGKAIGEYIDFLLIETVIKHKLKGEVENANKQVKAIQDRLSNKRETLIAELTKED